MNRGEYENDSEFRSKATKLIGDFFGILHDCKNEIYDREFVIRENQKYRITVKLSRNITLEFNYADPNTGQIKIKNKFKMDEKGGKFEQLFSYEILGGIYDLNQAENSLQTKIKIIENGSLAFKVSMNTIVIKIVIEDIKIGGDIHNVKKEREIIFTIVFKQSNNNNDNNFMYDMARHQQRAGYGNMQFNPMMNQPHGMGFKPYYY